MRWLPRLAVLTAGVAVALTLAAPSSSAGTALDLTRAPADFAAVMGYQPLVKRLADGTERLTNPSGACSVPGEGKPFDFEVACQAHDYGYDLLRYAERIGAALPSSARHDIDTRFTDDLRVQCAAEGSATTCDATVAIFSAAIGFNSWRQLSGPPDYEAGMTRTAGLVLLAGIGGTTLVRTRTRRRSSRLRGCAGSAG